jgi:hypothetical protein
MFNGLNRPFWLSNLRYRREVWELLCFMKHHSLTLISKESDSTLPDNWVERDFNYHTTLPLFIFRECLHYIYIEFWNGLFGSIRLGPTRDCGLDRGKTRALPRSGPTMGRSSLYPKPDRVDPWNRLDRHVDRARP